MGDAALPSLFLGAFDERRIRGALARAGVDERLRALGLFPYRVELELDDPFTHRHRLAVDAGVLVDSTMKVARRAFEGERDTLPVIEVLWLELTDPTRPLGAERTGRVALPGQRHPGLGLARQTLAVQVLAAKRLGCVAIFNRPRWWHNAELYLRGGYRWATPEGAALHARLAGEVAGLDLADASWTIERREPHVDLGEMWLPLARRLQKRAFASGT